MKRPPLSLAVSVFLAIFSWFYISLQGIESCSGQNKKKITLSSLKKPPIEQLEGVRLKALMVVAEELTKSRVNIESLHFSSRDIGDKFEIHPVAYNAQLKVDSLIGSYIYTVSKSSFKIISKVKEGAYSPPPGFE